MSAGDLQIGLRIGAYEVLGILGAGGMGKVYKVRNRITDRVEAMKVLLPNLAEDPALAERFLREIKVLASLQHPNIATLHTAECIDNQLLMLIEFADGITLDRKLRAGILPAAEAIRYVSQVLAALDYAHARSVIHRDIKPGNMLLTPKGVVKLLDFGIAKTTEDHHLTMTGTTVGSLYYMSPEQIRAHSGLDGRSDLYSVGVSLYELVTGKRPFDGDSHYSIMNAHLQSIPIPPLQYNPALPARLNDVILKAVSKEPDARFQTAAAFVDALSHVFASPSAAGTAANTQTMSGEQTNPGIQTNPGVPAPLAQTAAGASQPSAPEPTVRPLRKRTLWLTAGATVTAAVVVGVIQFGPKSGTNASANLAAVVSAPSQPAAPTVSPASGPSSQPGSAPAERTANRSVPQQPVRVESQASPAPQATASQAPAPSRSTPTQEPANGSAADGKATTAAPASPPTPDPAASRDLQQTRDRLVVLESRASSMHDSLDALRKSQASMGVGLRSDLQLSANLMDRYLENARSAIKAGDADSARQSIEKAEPEIKKLEQTFGK